MHVIDEAEASLHVVEDRYLAGVVQASLPAHDSSLVEVIGLPGAEMILVPNTRLEHVTAQDNARVIAAFNAERAQVSFLR